eukprot:6325901-Prorocentrum_lima.AAC.1
MLPACQVTTVAMAVAKIVHRSLALATKADEKGSVILYHTARDVLDLFRALVPTKHGTTIRG